LSVERSLDATLHPITRTSSGSAATPNSELAADEVLVFFPYEHLFSQG
jgi:hypothetical protein